MLRIVFMGTPQFSVPTLESLHRHHTIVAVYTQPDKPVGRGLELKPSPVKAKALEFNLPVFQPERLSLPGEFEKLQALQPDVIVVVAYGQILKTNVLQLPKLGCVNIHSSLLPRWRGAAPIQWAILEGDEETGITTMKMVEKLDAGDIFLQETTRIEVQDTASTVHDRLAEMGARLILPTLEGLQSGELKGIAQDETKITYAAKLTKEMEKLDPQQSALVLSRRIRALNPWPGTSIEVENSKGLKSRLKIKEARLQQDIQDTPGKIFEKAGMLLLGTTSGSLELLRVQWEGKKEMSAAEFLNGYRGK